jgi:hypothetical protein
MMVARQTLWGFRRWGSLAGCVDHLCRERSKRWRTRSVDSDSRNWRRAAKIDRRVGYPGRRDGEHGSWSIETRRGRGAAAWQRWRGRSRQGVVLGRANAGCGWRDGLAFRLLAGSCRSASHYGGLHCESILLVAATFGTIVRRVRTCAGALNAALAGLSTILGSGNEQCSVLRRELVRLSFSP